MPLNSRNKFALVFGLAGLVAFQFPAVAQLNAQPSLPEAGTKDSPVLTGDLQEGERIIAQVPTGSNVANVAAVGAISAKRQKGELLITDSLWGNLILDLAYQRDVQLRKLAKRLNIVNWGTTAAVTGIAGGTLAQGIIALSVLNPPSGQSDSYLPGAVGVGFAGLTLVTFAGRTVINQVLFRQLRKRQLEIKHQVESILARFESSHGDNEDARKELTSLIGERAANEWVQLWRSSNAIASLKSPGISLSPNAVLLGSSR